MCLNHVFVSNINRYNEINRLPLSIAMNICTVAHMYVFDVFCNCFILFSGFIKMRIVRTSKSMCTAKYNALADEHARTYAHIFYDSIVASNNPIIEVCPKFH